MEFATTRRRDDGRHAQRIAKLLTLGVQCQQCGAKAERCVNRPGSSVMLCATCATNSGLDRQIARMRADRRRNR